MYSEFQGVGSEVRPGNGSSTTCGRLIQRYYRIFYSLFYKDRKLGLRNYEISRNTFETYDLFIYYF